MVQRYSAQIKRSTKGVPTSAASLNATVIEPSEEFGYRDLEEIQGWRLRQDTSFPFRPDDLGLPLRLYRLRKSRREAKAAWDMAAEELRQGNAGKAAEILDSASRL